MKGKVKQYLIIEFGNSQLEKVMEAVQNKRKIVNKLNDLSGKEWIKFTKTWFIHRPAPRENLNFYTRQPSPNP
jgi:hypothetical protein